MDDQLVGVFLALCLALSFGGAMLASLILTPAVRSLAKKRGFVDRPDGGRKTHVGAVALGGGVAVLVAALVAATHTFAASTAAGLELLKDPGAEYGIYGLLGAAVFIFCVGLVDDYVGMRGRYKLVGQIIASSILMASGLVIHKVAFLGPAFDLGPLAYPLTLFWLLGAINAINLIDGIDGLASSVGIVLCLTLATMSTSQGFYAEAIITLALAGALLGFLRYNIAPASIFLGDSGSMLVGLVIGAVSISAPMKQVTGVALSVPFAVLAIPILDSAAAILRRKLTGRSVFATDRGHLHHSLLVRGWSARQAVLFISLICTFTCAGALASFFYKNEYIALFAVLGIVGFLIATRIFGHVEFALVTDRVRSTTRTLTTRNGGSKSQPHESRIHLQGSQEWDDLWTDLTKSADQYNLSRIELTLNLPAFHEAFYASWNCAGNVDLDDAWRIASPLVVGDQTIGKLVVMGINPEGSSFAHIHQIMKFLDPVEENVARIVSDLSQKHAAQSSSQQTEKNRLDDRDQAMGSTQPIPHG